MTQHIKLPAKVVETDHRLEGAANKANEALAKHRWHWTLDESNSDRVSFKAYARAVGRRDKTVSGQAYGYAEWVASGAGRPLNECIERAKMSAEKAELIEAVAEANEVSFGQARKAYANDVARVREVVERKLETKPDTTPEEKQDITRKVATTMARSRQATQRLTANKRSNRTASFTIMHGELSQAMRCVVRTLNEARSEPDLDDDMLELLTQLMGSIKAAMDLINMALIGSVNVDWDAELAKLQETN